MANSILTGAAALALLAVPALAQEATTGDQATGTAADQATAATGDQQMAAGGDPQMMRDAAIQSAEGVGITNVGDLAGAFVLQGTSPTGAPILMIVGPAGELVALATPIAGGVTGVEPTAADAGAAAGAATGAEAEAGEPAESGFMATQTQPAGSQMWDPAAIEGAMQGLGSGEGTTTGTAADQ